MRVCIIVAGRSDLFVMMAAPDFRRRHMIERAYDALASAPGDFANLIKKDRVQAGEIVEEADSEPQ